MSIGLTAMPNEDRKESTNLRMLTVFLRRVLLPLLIVAFGVILKVIADRANAPLYVYVLILVADVTLILYVAGVMPISFVVRLIAWSRALLRAVRPFLVWLALLFFFIFVVVWVISRQVPSAMKKAREGVRTIELALERGELCSLESQSPNPEISKVRLWIHYDSMTIEPLVEELTGTRGGVSTVSTLFFENEHVFAFRSPASKGGGFLQTYYDGGCAVGIDYLDSDLSIRALDYLACQKERRHMDSGSFFWPKDDPAFRPPLEARPCMLGSMGGPPPNGSVSVLPVPGLGLPYR